MAVEHRLQVTGMSCSGCENRVKAALSRIEGVIKTEADHRSGRVDVRADAARVTEEDVKERIRAAGYGIAR